MNMITHFAHFVNSLSEKNWRKKKFFPRVLTEGGRGVYNKYKEYFSGVGHWRGDCCRGFLRGKTIVKKEMAKKGSLLLAAAVLLAAVGGCGTEEKGEEPVSGISETTEGSVSESLSASEDSVPETTEEELPPVSYPCEYRTEELHCIYGETDLFGTLYTPEDGREKHPAVILSHGYNCIGNDMRDIAEALAQNGVTAYTFDYSGGSLRSESSGETVDMSIETEQDNLRHVIDMISETASADPDELYLYGESQGGFVAALTGAEMPDRIAGMFLVYPAFSIVDQWLAMDPETMNEPFSFMGGMTLSKTFYDGVPRYDVYEHISAFSNPVLIYQGDRDSVVNVSYAERIHEAFPDSELTIVEGAGHGFGGKDRKLVKDGVCGFFADRGVAD